MLCFRSSTTWGNFEAISKWECVCVCVILTIECLSNNSLDVMWLVICDFQCEHVPSFCYNIYYFHQVLASYWDALCYKLVYRRIHNWMRCSKCLSPYVGCSWFPLHHPTKWHHLHLLGPKDTLKSSFVSLACTDFSSSYQVLTAVLHLGTSNARQWCCFEEYIHRILVLK